jgi:hypothetical protein
MSQLVSTINSNAPADAHLVSPVQLRLLHTLATSRCAVLRAGDKVILRSVAEVAAPGRFMAKTLDFLVAEGLVVLDGNYAALAPAVRLA